MVLGKLPVPGRPTIWITVGQGPTALAVGAGGVVWTFLLSSILSLLFLPLWETARYRLKYCLKGPLNPQPTNQPISLEPFYLDGSNEGSQYSFFIGKNEKTMELVVNSAPL